MADPFVQSRFSPTLSPSSSAGGGCAGRAGRREGGTSVSRGDGVRCLGAEGWGVCNSAEHPAAVGAVHFQRHLDREQERSGLLCFGTQPFVSILCLWQAWAIALSALPLASRHRHRRLLPVCAPEHTCLSIKEKNTIITTPCGSCTNIRCFDSPLFEHSAPEGLCERFVQAASRWESRRTMKTDESPI